MRLATLTLVFVFAIGFVVDKSLAFAPHSSSVVKRIASRRPQSQLYFFGRNKHDEEKDDDEKEDKPFFARFLDRLQQLTDDQAVKLTSTNDAPVMSTKENPGKSEIKTVETPTKKHEMTPMEQAKALKAQAERMRLEAERMDAQLTLDKVERLEMELKKAKKKAKLLDELKRELEALQAKRRGEAPKPKEITPKKEEATPSATRAKTPDAIFTSSTTDAQPVDEEKFRKILKNYESSPDWMKRIMAGAVAMYHSDMEDVNATEVALRTEMMERSDYSFLKDVPEPVFTQEQIDEIKKNPLFGAAKMSKKGSEDDVACHILKEQYYSEIMTTKLGSAIEDDPFFNIDTIMNVTELDKMVESLFPNACRKEGQTPTLAQANMLVTDVLPKAGFNPSSKPEPVEGGYIIRGTNKLDSGDGLVESIDAALAKSPIGRTMSVFYINDFTVFTEEQMENDFSPGVADPVLLVTGPNVYREPRRLLYSAVSAFGIASSWYLSIYPFLLNPDLMKRAEEQMSLADANMAYDLTWLTDLSLPLFLTFMGIQLTHEIGHRAVAAAYGMNITVPTFVPSLITGITSTVTTFKAPPKNREAMFDFSIAGPLAGIAASIVALYLGLEFTLFSTAEAAAQFPALPLEILRQSTLGGGIVEFMLGAGALAVPGGAEGSSAISSITITLHPVAIAGYISLIVNSLALLPIGTTDGGRIAMTLFSRGGKIVVSQLFLVLLFTLGIFGSDLFLFYFSFLIFFQQGNEIPARNEVDEVSFPRVLLATAASVISLLALIPIS